jgi:hypothetical protein
LATPEPNTRLILELTKALDLLAEIERVADGRPGPGTRRPAPEPRASGRPAAAAEPADMLPLEPASASAAQVFVAVELEPTDEHQGGEPAPCRHLAERPED